MMIVDQWGELAINLNNIATLRINSYTSEHFYLEANTIDQVRVTLGIYPTKEKATAALQDLLKCVDWVQVKSEQKEEENVGI